MTATTHAPTRVPRDQKPISARQENYIVRLVAERFPRNDDGEPDFTDAPASVAEAMGRVADLSNQAAGDLIDVLLSLPIPADKEPSPVGYYIHEGVLVKVQENKHQTNTYAMTMSVRHGEVRWDYTPDLGRAFGPTPLTTAKARAAAVKAGLSKEQAAKDIA